MRMSFTMKFTSPLGQVTLKWKMNIRISSIPYLTGMRNPGTVPQTKLIKFFLYS